jgi:hypothetical protein
VLAPAGISTAQGSHFEIGERGAWWESAQQEAGYCYWPFGGAKERCQGSKKEEVTGGVLAHSFSFIDFFYQLNEIFDLLWRDAMRRL